MTNMKPFKIKKLFNREYLIPIELEDRFDESAKSFKERFDLSRGISQVFVFDKQFDEYEVNLNNEIVYQEEFEVLYNKCPDCDGETGTIQEGDLIKVCKTCLGAGGIKIHKVGDKVVRVIPHSRFIYIGLIKQ